MHTVFMQTDPFNRSHLTQDMLIPNTELKLQIEEFVRSQQSRKRTADESEIGEPDGTADMVETAAESEIGEPDGTADMVE